MCVYYLTLQKGNYFKITFPKKERYFAHLGGVFYVLSGDMRLYVRNFSAWNLSYNRGNTTGPVHP